MNYSLILSHQVFWWTVLGVFGSLFAVCQPAVGPMELLQSMFDDRANNAFTENSISNPMKWFLYGADYTPHLVDVSGGRQNWMAINNCGKSSSAVG